MGTDIESQTDQSPGVFDIEDPREFYAAIERKHLANELSPGRPYVYWTMEVYDKANGIKGGGGLGVLAADTRRVAEQLEVPFVVVTPFYRTELHQAVKNGKQVEYYEPVSPDDYGFERRGDVVIKTVEGGETRLDVFEKIFGSSRFLTISEINFGELYASDGSGDHRLYQEVALGFGGYKALRLVGLRPAVIQLNETATVFAAIARLDELCRNGMNLFEAIVYVRKHTLYTNHTLVQAAESEFNLAQFERFVMPNIESAAVRSWIGQQFTKDGHLRLSALAIELTEAKNGVSKLHARVCDFRDSSGERVKFHAVTNGIDLQTWVMPEILNMFVEKGIMDKFGLVTDNFAEMVRTLQVDEIRALKRLARQRANEVLSSRKDQNNRAVRLPEDSLIFDFKRRFADYKRPDMPFENTEELKRILLKYNAHYIMSGKVWLGDARMYSKLHSILDKVSKDKVLNERVHYIQDYDEAVGRALAFGSDVAINIPQIGLEACGTSWEKDIANLKLLISTADGGVADVIPLPCLEVAGANHRAEVDSLYRQMERAGEIINDDAQLAFAVHKQLSAYLPTISGARMLKDYLKFLFNKQA